MSTLRQRTFSGLGWNGAAQLSIQVLQFLTSVAVARLLSPREFGLMAMVMVFAGFASIFSDLGLGAALVQRKDLSERHLNSVFWINVGAGLLLTGVFVAGAPFVARFYDQPLLRSLTAVLSLTFIPSALGVVQNSLIDKSLNFRTRFRIEATSSLVSGIAAVFLAVKGAGVWSLVGQSVTSAVMRVAITWRVSSWRPSFSFDLAAAKELFPFSRNLLGNSVFSYWGRNTDRLMLGRFVGSTGLGVYSFAFRSVNLPLEITTNVTNTVLFPALSTIQEDYEKLRRAYLRSTRMIALVTFPIMIGLAALSEPAVLLLYGNRWRASIGIIRILAFSAMAQSVYNTATWLFLSQGRTDIVFRLGIYATLVRISGVTAGIFGGVTGVAWAYVVGSYGFLWYPTWRVAGGLLNLRFSKLVGNVAGPFFCSACMGGIVWVCDQRFTGHLAAWLRLAAGIPLGIFLYVFLVKYTQAWRDLRQALLEVGGERFPVLGHMLGKVSQARP